MTWEEIFKSKESIVIEITSTDILDKLLSELHKRGYSTFSEDRVRRTIGSKKVYGVRIDNLKKCCGQSIFRWYRGTHHRCITHEDIRFTKQEYLEAMGSKGIRRF